MYNIMFGFQGALVDRSFVSFAVRDEIKSKRYQAEAPNVTVSRFHHNRVLLERDSLEQQRVAHQRMHEI